MKTYSTSTTTWLATQTKKGCTVLLVIDRQAMPDPIAQLFTTNVMHDYVNLFQNTEFTGLADVGPWLVKVNVNHLDAIKVLLDSPECNWGWLASVEDFDKDAIAKHLFDRALVDIEGRRFFYAFQDNRVFVKDLEALDDQQILLLLGPLNSVLCWDGVQWVGRDNPAPAYVPKPFITPWVNSEKNTEANQALRRQLQNWLWAEQSAPTLALLAQGVVLEAWLDYNLELAGQLGWDSFDSSAFLLQHKLNPDVAEQPFWTPLADETPWEHFARCQEVINSHQIESNLP